MGEPGLFVQEHDILILVNGGERDLLRGETAPLFGKLCGNNIAGMDFIPALCLFSIEKDQLFSFYFISETRREVKVHPHDVPDFFACIFDRYGMSEFCHDTVLTVLKELVFYFAPEVIVFESDQVDNF